MAIVINGTGTVAGLSVGGINDGAIANADLADSTKPIFSSYAIISNQLSAGTQGGTPTANSWTTYALNTEIADPDSIVSISSNKFTLAAGSYLIKWKTLHQNCERSITRLYDVTNTAIKQYSMPQYNIYTTAVIPGFARVSPSGSTEYRIEYYSDAAQADYGLGMDAPDDVAVTINAIVEIYKEAS